jgi:hypothetical protein
MMSVVVVAIDALVSVVTWHGLSYIQPSAVRLLLLFVLVTLSM